jgi:UDP-2,3-diacylglucosamine pyrophosphatase LpxH
MGEILDTLILSDVHLGSETSRAANALDLLESLRYRRLILLGDIFSDLNFRRLTGEHWKFLSCIRKLSNPKRKIEVVWVEGNHDHGLANLMSHLVGVPVYQRYVWEFSGLRHLAVHGHQFDRFISRNLLLSRIGEGIYGHVQKIDSRSKCVARFLDRMSTRWLRLSGKVAQGALSYARQGWCSRVFCGHTHEALALIQDGIEYYNTGCWVDTRATYAVVDESGARIQEYGGCSAQTILTQPAVQMPRSKAAARTQIALPLSAPSAISYKSLRCG